MIVQIVYRTWQDRRKFKRRIENEYKNSSLVDREKIISQQIKDDNNHRLQIPIYLSMEIEFLSTNNDYIQGQIRFDLKNTEQLQSFIDLNHFLTLYIPKMLENQPTN